MRRPAARRRSIQRRALWSLVAALAGTVATCAAALMAAAPTAAATTATTSATTTPAATTTPTARHQAAASYDALQDNLYKGGKSLYLGSPSDTCGKYSCLWPFTNAMAGTLFLYGGPRGSRFSGDVASRLVGLEDYADPNEVSPTGAPQPPAYESGVAPPRGPGGSTYYDDNAWVGLNLVHAYLLTSVATDLTLAQDEFDFAISGWDTTSSDPCPGGVFWEDTAGSQRNATANGGNAELGLELYRLTGNTSDLTWATSMFDWVVTCLGTTSGLYDDHVNPDGSVNTTIWSYNQGVMVGAGVLLAAATGDDAYLEQAQQTATAAVAYFGTGSVLDNQGPAFNAIYFRNLYLLDQVAPDPDYAAEAQSFASTMWAQRQAGTGLIDPQYGVNGTAPMVEIYSLLAGSPPAP